MGEAEAVAGGEGAVGVAQEPVDGGVGDGLGRGFAEFGWRVLVGGCDVRFAPKEAPMATRCPRLALAAVAVALVAAACSGDAVGAGESQAVDEVRVRPPLPWGVRDIWYHQTGLLLTVDEDVWADRLDRVCENALGADVDSPVWDRQAAQALGEEFAEADGLRPDLPPQWREQFLSGLSTTLWIMIVQRTGLDGPNVCWDRVPPEFLDAGLRAGGSTGGQTQLPPEFDTRMTDEALAAVKARFDRMSWRVEPPLPPRTRDIWWEATGLRATVDEDIWAGRLNRACNTPIEDPVWDEATAAVLAEEFIVEDGGQPSPELVEAAADALWQMTTQPQSGACPRHYPAGTFEPEFVERMKEQRRAALS